MFFLYGSTKANVKGKISMDGVLLLSAPQFQNRGCVALQEQNQQLKNNNVGTMYCYDGCKIIDDLFIGSNENKVIQTLIDEYEAIKKEDFKTYEEYEAAKRAAYDRLKDAMNTVNNNSNGRATTNTNNFAKAIDSIGQFFKNIGKEILEFFMDKFVPAKKA